MAGPDDSLSRLTPLASADVDAVMAFLDSMPEGDRTFFKDGDDRETVERWVNDTHALRWILPGDGDIAAYLAVIPGAGWSSHVGELRLVVGAGYRRCGLGRRLARRGLLEAVQAGLDKIVVEVVADRQGDIEMFTSIGFSAEALLTNQIRDRTGQTRDLVILAHDVAAVRDSMEILGIDEAAGASETASR
jgi:ribosomal protein S18 acetylase RimI-like enzyme